MFTPYYVARNVATGEILSGMPSARLIQAGHGDAYVRDGIVYLRERDYESPDGTYIRVRVIRNPEFNEAHY